MKPGMRLGSNGFRGRLWLVEADREEITEMFSVSTDERKQMVITPNVANLKDFGQVSAEEAKTWVEAVE